MSRLLMIFQLTLPVSMFLLTLPVSISLLTLPATLPAAQASSPTPAPQASGGGTGASFTIGNAEITNGTITPGTPPKLDRQQQSKAASAAARSAAGMQRVMCMKMMNDARKESDKTDKMIMMMMANQACQQANETEKNANENDKNQKKMTDDDGLPKMATLTMGKFGLKPSTTQEPQLPVDDGSSASGDSGSSATDSPIPLVSPLSPDLGKLRTVADEPSADPAKAVALPDDPTSKLKQIPGPSTAYDENARKEGGALSVGGGGGSPYATARTVAQTAADDSKKGDAANAGGTGKLAGRGLASAEPAPGGGGAGGGPESASSGGGNDSLDAVLAQMMGGGAAEMSAGPGQDVLVLPDREEGSSKLPNIFEFAAWRYQKATFEEGRVRTKPRNPSLPLAPKMAKVSKP